MNEHEMTQETAKQAFAARFSCSQIVFAHLAGKLGIDPLLARKIAAPFGTGMGLAETCGCVTGALMALGVKYGSCEAKDTAARKLVAQKRAALLKTFQDRHGSLHCRDLLGCDATTPAGEAQKKEGKLTEKVCTGLVCDACAIAEALLEEKK